MAVVFPLNDLFALQELFEKPIIAAFQTFVKMINVI
jgi:hypothetical protein